VDIPLVLYSLSFAPNPSFTRVFASQHELLRYIRHVASEFGVLNHIRKNQRVGSAAWNDESSTWTVKFQDTQTGQLWTQECAILI
jgi:cation diffusion facilitator CzcD-associated flavoprotein CzcO